MKSRLLLDIVIAERATVLELLACEDQALLVGRNADLDAKALKYTNEQN
jgi:hypothetical protein